MAQHHAAHLTKEPMRHSVRALSCNAMCPHSAGRHHQSLWQGSDGFRSVGPHWTLLPRVRARHLKTSYTSAASLRQNGSGLALLIPVLSHPAHTDAPSSALFFVTLVHCTTREGARTADKCNVFALVSHQRRPHQG